MRVIVFMMELDPSAEDGQPIILGVVGVPECFSPTDAMLEDAAALNILIGTADSDELPFMARLPFMLDQGETILDALRARRATFN